MVFEANRIFGSKWSNQRVADEATDVIIAFNYAEAAVVGEVFLVCLRRMRHWKMVRTQGVIYDGG